MHLRYDGSDTSLDVPFGPVPEMVAAYETAYRSRFGFVMPGKGVIAATISVEAIGHTFDLECQTRDINGEAAPISSVAAYMAGAFSPHPSMTATGCRREAGLMGRH